MVMVMKQVADGQSKWQMVMKQVADGHETSGRWSKQMAGKMMA